MSQALLLFSHSWMVSSIAFFHISHLFAHSLNIELFYLTHRYLTLSDATTSDQSGLRRNGNEGVLHILQTSPSDCLVSYLGHLLGESYPSAEIQSVYSNWLGQTHFHTIRLFNVISKTLIGVGVLPLGNDVVGVFYSPSRLGYHLIDWF